MKKKAMARAVNPRAGKTGLAIREATAKEANVRAASNLG
jgi:hypothetical protein